MFTGKQRIYNVENYIVTKSYQKTISRSECKFLSVSTLYKAISHLVKKFCEEGTVKNLTHQRHHHILTPTKMSEIRMKFSTTSQNFDRKVSAQVKTSYSLTHRATKLLKLYPCTVSVVQELNHQIVPRRQSFVNGFPQIVPVTKLGVTISSGLCLMDK